MPVAKPPDIPERSPLWALSFRVERIQSEFNGLYEDIKDVWLIGEYLAWPFYFIQYALGEAVTIIREADSWIVKHRSWLESLFDGWKFTEILDSISSEIRWMRVDPVGWLRERIKLVSPEFSGIIYQAQVWVKEKVLQVFPFLYDAQFNPINWIRGLIQTAFSTVFVFLINPKSTLRSWVKELAPLLSGIISSGISYIISDLNSYTGWFSSFIYYPHNTIRNWLRDINFDLDSFLTSPRQWLIQKLAEVFGLQTYEINSFPSLLGLIVLRNLRDNLDLYSSTLETIICDIVLKFI